MFERFTDRARRVLVLAQDEARALEHNFLGTEHILLGMASEGEGLAAKALGELGVDLASLRAKVGEVVTPGAPGTASGAPPFTPRSKKVLELSLREALDLGHNYIGTEHLLLGLIQEASGVAAQVLVAQGLDLSTVRAKVIELLRGYATTNPVGRTTPAGAAISTKANAIAGTEALGSQHFLLALLEDPSSLAARALASLGVTKEAVVARVEEIGLAGTSDEDRPLPGLGGFKLGLGHGLSLHIDDAALVEQVKMQAVEGPGDLADAIRAAVKAWLAQGEEQGGSEWIGKRSEPPTSE